MNGSVGGAVVPTLTGVSLGGKNYTSGWSGAYTFNTKPEIYKVETLETKEMGKTEFKGRTIEASEWVKQADPYIAAIVNNVSKQTWKDITKLAYKKTVDKKLEKVVAAGFEKIGNAFGKKGPCIFNFG